MPSPCPAEFVDFAARLAEASGAPIRRHFRTPIAVEAKADATPVTIADREAEAAMRALIAGHYPDHGIIGEELGTVRPDAADTWALDPIDGTKSFITGMPIFGTLIALLHDGRPILGVIDQPILGERWVGAAGWKTTFNGAPAAVRACADLDAAILSATSPDIFTDAERASFDRLAARTRHTVYGGDCYAYGQLACGYIDLVVEAGLAAHDFCALVPVIAGAGGIMTDWRGEALHAGSNGRVIAAGDPAVHQAALSVLAESAG